MSTNQQALPPAERLCRVLQQHPGPLAIVGHNYPDPDCMAAALGLQTFIVQTCGRTPILGFGGGLGRAENRAMAGILDIEFVEVSELSAGGVAGVILVDTQPGAGNCSLDPAVPILGVVDHHERPEEPAPDLPFCDVRTELGASCTIVKEYLDSAEVELETRVATALLVGIRTDTEDLERDESDADVQAFLDLYPRASRPQMQQIMRPPLSENYFATLRQALQVARRWADTVVCNVGPIMAPDLLSEVSELFTRLKGVELSLALGEFEGGLYLSLRSARIRRKALSFLAAAAGPDGQVGGHGRAYGGRCAILREVEGAEVAEAVMKRFLAAAGAIDEGPKPVCLDEKAVRSAPSVPD